MKNNKREKGSITVVVFATVTLLLVLLATTYTTINFKRRSQVLELQKLKETYDVNMTVAYNARDGKQRIIVGGNIIEVPSGLETMKTHYGELVTSFGSVDEVEWMLFYDDEDYYYLIASDYVKNTTLPTSLYKRTVPSYKANFYSSSSLSSSFLNSGKWTQGSALITDTKYIQWADAYPNESTAYGIRATAFMLDKTSWRAFAGDAPGAYAIGGPTLEMFIKSYNAAHSTSPLTEITIIPTSNADRAGLKSPSSVRWLRD